MPPAFVLDGMTTLGWGDDWIGEANRQDLTYPMRDPPRTGSRAVQVTTPGASSRSVTSQVGEFCELPQLRLLDVRRAAFDRGRRDCLFERCHAIAAVRGIRENRQVR